MTDAVTSYASGTWVGVAGAQVWLLADVAPTEPVVAACWELVRVGAEVDRVLGAILSAGFRSVASFALVRYVDRVAHVVVRGGARVELVGSSGELVEVLTVQAGDWADRTIDQPPAQLRLLATVSAAGATGPVLPLDGGVVLASGLEVRMTAGSLSVPARVQPPVAVPPKVSVAPPPPPAPEPLPTNGVSAFDRMFGATELPQAEEEEFFPEPPRPALVAPPVAPIPDSGATLPPMQTLVPQPRPDTGLIEDVSWAEPVDSARPARAPQRPHPLVPQPGDELADDLLITVHRARPSTPVEPANTGPVVSAVRCVNGHLNPTTATTCRICAGGVAVQAPVVVSRPTLGVLRLSDGEVIQLDRGVILGRAPGIPEGNDRDRPHHVKLPSPDNDISRKHVEVRLDGWQVTVVDLNSRNGTIVTPPDGVPETLAPGGSRVIEPGSVVSLTGTTSFRFEVTG